MLTTTIDCHIISIINKDISNNKFSENPKTATVRPIFKKGDRTKIKNCRPVSLLNIFTKIYKRLLHKNLTKYVDTFLSKFISAYTKSYHSNHVKVTPITPITPISPRLIEIWKKSLDQKKFVGALLMDFSKAFDSLTHDLLIAKMYAYSFSKNSLVSFYSYLKRWKQNVRITNTYSFFKSYFQGY